MLYNQLIGTINSFVADGICHTVLLEDGVYVNLLEPSKVFELFRKVGSEYVLSKNLEVLKKFLDDILKENTEIKGELIECIFTQKGAKGKFDITVEEEDCYVHITITPDKVTIRRTPKEEENV